VTSAKVGPDEGFCAKRGDGTHCNHWWDGDQPCCACGGDAGAPPARGISFRAGAVRSILARRKTQTRRLVDFVTLRIRPRHDVVGEALPGEAPLVARAGQPYPIGMYGPHGTVVAILEDSSRLGMKPGEFDFVCPYADTTTELASEGWRLTPKPGQRLWVAEPWKSEEHTCGVDFNGDHDDPYDDAYECGPHCAQTYVYYEATPRVGYRPAPDRARIRYLDESSPLTRKFTSDWRPATAMREEHARAFLVPTLIRLERLHRITDEDARAEGVRPFFERFECIGREQRLNTGELAADAEYRASFACHWDHVYDDTALWKENRFVWAIHFELGEVRT
jgi:hypothetical protein